MNEEISLGCSAPRTVLRTLGPGRVTRNFPEQSKSLPLERNLPWTNTNINKPTEPMVLTNASHQEEFRYVDFLPQKVSEIPNGSFLSNLTRQDADHPESARGVPFDEKCSSIPLAQISDTEFNLGSFSRDDSTLTGAVVIDMCVRKKIRRETLQKPLEVVPSVPLQPRNTDLTRNAVQALTLVKDLQISPLQLQQLQRVVDLLEKTLSDDTMKEMEDVIRTIYSFQNTTLNQVLEILVKNFVREHHSDAQATTEYSTQMAVTSDVKKILPAWLGESILLHEKTSHATRFAEWNNKSSLGREFGDVITGQTAVRQVENLTADETFRKKSPIQQSQSSDDSMRKLDHSEISINTSQCGKLHLSQWPSTVKEVLEDSYCESTPVKTLKHRRPFDLSRASHVCDLIQTNNIPLITEDRTFLESPKAVSYSSDHLDLNSRPQLGDFSHGGFPDLCQEASLSQLSRQTFHPECVQRVTSLFNDLNRFTQERYEDLQDVQGNPSALFHYFLTHSLKNPNLFTSDVHKSTSLSFREKRLGMIHPAVQQYPLVPECIVLERLSFIPADCSSFTPRTQAYRIADSTGSIILCIKDTELHKQSSPLSKSRLLSSPTIEHEIPIGSVVQLRDVSVQWVHDQMVIVIESKASIFLTGSMNICFSRSPDISQLYSAPTFSEEKP